MLLDVKTLSDDKRKSIEEFLFRFGVSFTSDNEKNIMNYQEKLREELSEITNKTNRFNIKTINLVVKAAIPEYWIGNDVLRFYFFSTIRKDSDGDYYFGDKHLELMMDVKNQEGIEGLLCYIKEQLSLNYDFTFSTKNTGEFSFDSEQEEIIQIF